MEFEQAENEQPDPRDPVVRESWVKRYLAVALAAVRPLFPIGAVYVNVTGVDPATELGYGTWAEFGAGRVMVGYVSGDPVLGTVEAAVGAATHSHTYTDVLQHTHIVTDPGHQHSVSTHSSAPDNGGAVSVQGSETPSVDTFDVDSGTTGITLEQPAGSVAEGVTATASSLPPAIVVHMWKRTG
jgi:hypothetical protein